MAPGDDKRASEPTKPAARRPARRGAATKGPSGDSAPAPTEQAATAEEAPASAAEGHGLDLYVLRHADAGDPAAWPGDDTDRPLSKKGKRQSTKLGRLLADLGVRPDALLTSPKLRALDTARIVGKRIKVKPQVDQRLGGRFEGDSLAELLGGLGPETGSVMLVGHDPDFSSLVSWLVGAPLTLRKGALARLELRSRSAGPGGGALRWLLSPDAVPD